MKNPGFISQLATTTSETVSKIASPGPAVGSLSTGSSVHSTSSMSSDRTFTKPAQNGPESHELTENKCDICQMAFISQDFLVKHKSLVHPNSSLNELTPKNITNSDAYCEFCDKSFCDRYFFRKHMKKTHNITLTDKNNVVQCEICDKKVCSKYFLRTHKEKVHGIYENRNAAPRISHTISTLFAENQQSNQEFDDDDNEPEPGEITYV
jgi:hypothetical protein